MIALGGAAAPAPDPPTTIRPGRRSTKSHEVVRDLTGPDSAAHVLVSLARISRKKREDMVDATLSIEELRKKAREDAADVLKRFWADGRLPVDPIEIARSMGLSVFTSQLGNDTWGMIIGSASGADIYLDKDQAPTRMRFSCAHELGHSVDRAAALTPNRGYIDKRSSTGSHNVPAEIYANEFAASLLAPEDDMRRMVMRGDSNIEIASVFGISLTSVEYRRQFLGI